VAWADAETAWTPGAVVASQAEAIRQREIETMTQQPEEKWEQWARERGIEIGREEGRQEGLVEGDLRALRQALRALPEERFRPLPESIKQRVAASPDPAQLRQALVQVLHVSSLDEFTL
jgi:flagellar biosynthesis/type III secretory pathway protein FliH